MAQLFLPLGVFGLFEKNNFLELTAPVKPSIKGITSYTIAPDETTLINHLKSLLVENPGAIILPEGVSVKWWSTFFPESIVDTHPKSVTTQKRLYLDILTKKYDTLIGTRRTLLKRLGHFTHLYIVYENLSQDIMFGRRHIPLWMMIRELEKQGHVIHYITTTPSVRTLTDFLQHKKSVHYL